MRTNGKGTSAFRFAVAYDRKMQSPKAQQQFNPLRDETVRQASGVVLEVGVGGGLNFPFYDPGRVVRIEAVEPDETMREIANRRLEKTSIPIQLTQASVEALPFPDTFFDSVVVIFVFCSVQGPQRWMQEIWRVLKPGGSLFLLEHVRSQRGPIAWVQDMLVPLTTHLGGNCHWNRETGAIVQQTGFRITKIRKVKEGFQPMHLLQALCPYRTEEGSNNETP